MFDRPPSQQKVVETVRAELGVKLTAVYAKRVTALVTDFVEKGKRITKADLQYIVENVLKALSEPAPILEVEDFQITTSLKHKPPPRSGSSLTASACNPRRPESVRWTPWSTP